MDRCSTSRFLWPSHIVIPRRLRLALEGSVRAALYVDLARPMSVNACFRKSPVAVSSQWYCDGCYMPLFYTDSVTLAYSDLDAAKRWWIEAFDGKVATVPADWDCSLPSDVALQLPGHDAPTILLSAKSEIEQAGYDRPSPLTSVIFCQKLKKGHEQLESRGVFAGPIQDGGDTHFFEIRDIEGNVIQICKEP
jgi:hypothetical protein